MASILTLYIEPNGTSDIEMKGKVNAHSQIVSSKGSPPHRPSFVTDDEWELIKFEINKWGQPQGQLKVIWARYG
jgi:hypothetical protein